MSRGDPWQATANRLAFNFSVYFIFVSKTLKLVLGTERRTLVGLGFKQDKKMHLSFIGLLRCQFFGGLVH